MCERNDTPAGETVGNLVYQRFKKQLADSNYEIKCRKCNVNSGYVLLQKKDVFCGECLVEYCKHKFRATMGRSKLLVPGIEVLVAISGGTSSVALVDLIKIGLEGEDVHRRLRFVPALLHIDESILNKSATESSTESPSIRRDLFDYMTQSGLDCYFTSLELCLSSSTESNFIKIPKESSSEYSPKSFPETSSETTPETSSYERVESFLRDGRSKYGSDFLRSFNRLGSLSSKYDFISRLRYLIMVKVAGCSGFGRIFVATTASELSTSLMTDISMGRGVELQSEMNFCSDRYPSVSILRPLREFTQKELSFYCRYRHLDSLILKLNPSTTTTTSIKSSIHRLTESFLNNLAEEFPSTIYTVFKTGNKITSSTDQNLDSDAAAPRLCVFCWSKLDTRVQHDPDHKYSAFDALQLTSLLSIGGGNGGELDIPKGNSISDNTHKYCYSCLRLNSEMNSNDNQDHFHKFCII